jgi:glycosyltransferase involved in cell wall biosynthesis
MQPRRLLLLITDLQLGGTPTVVRELAMRLRQAVPSIHIEVACLAPSGPVADQLRRAGIPMTTLDSRRPTDLRTLPRLVALLRRGQFDTVFSFLIHANALAAAALPWAPPARWLQSIQTTQPWPRWHWHVQRLVHRAAEAVVVPSSSVAQAAVVWAGVQAEKIVIIPNAVDPAEFAGAGLATAATAAMAAKTPHPFPITFLGRLDPVKDVPTLIDAVAILNGRVRLTVVGEGSDRARIQRRIAERNVQHLVTLVGAIEHPRDALAGTGLLVLPSLAEGFGLVLIEAMAAGVPVISTDVPGVRDVVRANKTGLLVPAANPAALAAAIERVIDDRPLRERLIAAAAADVKRRFSWEVVLPQYLQLLQLP